MSSYGLARTEVLGRALFGKPSRLRVGMWISTLPGNPHTFTTKEYWRFCSEQDWPGVGTGIRTDLMRYVELEMIRERTDLKKRGVRSIFWTKSISPLWEILEVAKRSLQFVTPESPPSSGDVLRAQRGLLRLARGLADD